MSYLTFCLLSLSSRVLLFSLGVAEELFEELEKEPGFSGVQLEKFGWFKLAAAMINDDKLCEISFFNVKVKTLLLTTTTHFLTPVE